MASEKCLIIGFLIFLISVAVDSLPREKDPSLDKLYAERPALRHHIAHFCPNLDEARVCIRKCAKKGKPAFCGKDHRCYCGHKYSAHDEKGAMNAEDLHSQFHDLYEKYFGPNTGSGIDDDEIKNLERK